MIELFAEAWDLVRACFIALAVAIVFVAFAQSLGWRSADGLEVVVWFVAFVVTRSRPA